MYDLYVTVIRYNCEKGYYLYYDSYIFFKIFNELFKNRMKCNNGGYYLIS